MTTLGSYLVRFVLLCFSLPPSRSTNPTDICHGFQPGSYILPIKIKIKRGNEEITSSISHHHPPCCHMCTSARPRTLVWLRVCVWTPVHIFNSIKFISSIMVKEKSYSNIAGNSFMWHGFNGCESDGKNRCYYVHNVTICISDRTECALLVDRLVAILRRIFPPDQPNEKKNPKIIFTSHTSQCFPFACAEIFMSVVRLSTFILASVLLLLFFYIVHSLILPSVCLYVLFFMRAMAVTRRTHVKSYVERM